MVSLTVIAPVYAVQGFYIVSGFYMSLILNEKYKTAQSNTIFYKKRFLRIMPTYWLLAIIALLIAIYYYHIEKSSVLFFEFERFPSFSSFFTYLYIIFSNIFVWGQDAALFLHISPETGNPQFSYFSFAEQYPMLRFMLIPGAWSISTEFSFYIIAPHILRNRIRIVHTLFVVSFLSNILTNYLGLNDSNWRFRFFPSTLIFFLTGYYAYLIYKYLIKRKLSSTYKYPVLIGFLIFINIVMKTDSSYIIHIITLLITGVLIIPFLFYSFKDYKADRNIGEISYPLYLIHPIFIGMNELAGINNNAL